MARSDRHRRAPVGLAILGIVASVTSCRCSVPGRPKPQGPAPVLADSVPVGPAAPAAPAPAPVSGAPYVLYTDLVAGPTSGGENGKGVYLSVFGTNFGAQGAGTKDAGSTVKVLIGGVEVDNYRYLGRSRGRRDVQQLTVQVGALGHPTPGRPLPVAVVVGGVSSNTNHTFTVQPGDIRFVSTTGNDATAVKNDISHPWRYVQRPDEQGALGASRPGDVVVLRGGPGVVWSDVGYDNRWFRFRRATGNAPTGAKGHGYIAFIPYPGEDVHYVPPPGTSGGIHGIGENYPEFSDWIVVSGMHIESVTSSRTDAAPVNLQVRSDHWRIVNNELGPWPAPAEAHNHAGGITGNGTDVEILGNEIHGIGGGFENHGIYLDSNATDVEIAYNEIHDIAAGNIIQTYDNLGSSPIVGIRVHHNLLHAGGRYGLNIADGTRSYRAWDNVIYDTGFAGVRFNVYGDPAVSIAVIHNTIFDAALLVSGTNGVVANNWALTSGTVIVENNIFAVDDRSKAESYFADNANGSAIRFRRNLWYGRGRPPGRDEDPVESEDPKFADPAAHDFSLAAGSPAIDQAAAPAAFEVRDDVRFKARPDGAAADVGAYER